MRVVARRALTVFNLSAVPIFFLYYYEIETSEFNISGVWVRVNLYPKPYLVILLSILGRSFIPPGTPEGGLGGGGQGLIY